MLRLVSAKINSPYPLNHNKCHLLKYFKNLFDQIQVKRLLEMQSDVGPHCLPLMWDHIVYL